MSDKIQTNIYLLREEIRIFEKNKKLIKELNFDFVTKFLRSKGFKEQKVLENLKTKYEIKVFHKKTPTEVKWKEFIKNVVQNDEAILKENKSWIESFVILFKNEKGQIFASTGGYANATMQEIATPDFGIEILSRIVTADAKNLKSTKERNLTGGIQGEVKFFRNDHNLYENDSFGKVYNELNALLTKQILKDNFGFKYNDLRSDSICIAKSYFSIKKAISFEELERLVAKCEDIMTKEPKVEINSIDKISRKENVLLESLREEIISKIFGNYKDDNNFFSVEISNKDFEKYFQANKTEFSFNYKREQKKVVFDGCVRAIQELLLKIKEVVSDCTIDDFRKIINSSYLQTFDENEIELTNDRLFDHFCTEVCYDDKTYFLMEKDWYIIKKSFLDYVNKQAKEFLNEKKYDGPKMLPWKKDTSENSYNRSYIGTNDCFVFDRFTPENIEACDVLRIDDSNNAYFFHVKKGFDNSMRDLCMQVYIAGKKVFEDSKSGFKYLESLYDITKENKGEKDYSIVAKKQFDNVTKSEFINKIKGKKIIIVLAVLDSAVKDRDLYNEIEKFESNIAKFTLIELVRNLNALGIQFQITQLKKAI